MKETQPSAAGPLKGHDSAALARRIDSFDQRFEELLQGPAGTELRRAHLFEQLATRIFNGDYEKAQAALNTPHPQLGGRSANEAAETHEGMIEVKRLLAMATAEEPKPTCGLGYFIQSLEEGWRNEFEPLLDLLPAAWALNADQFALLLGTPPPTMTDWQQHTVKLDDALKSRLTRLRRLHFTFRAIAKPENYSEIWRIVWDRQTPIGARSLWQAYEEDGDPALDAMEVFFRSLTGPF